MAQIFGDFSDELPVSREYLTIVFSPSSVPCNQRWQNNGLSADFMADYCATFFPESEKATTQTDIRAEVKSAASFIANELLENAMKFNDETSSHPISITLLLYSDRLVFLATNTVNLQAVGKLQTFIEELSNSNPNELYIRQLEKNAEDETLSGSGLGFLTMINDYLVKIGWKFETLQKEAEVIVTTMVNLAV